MKVLLVALALVAGSAQAMQKDCNPYLVAENSETGLMHYVYPCGESYEVTYRSCVNGEVGYFEVENASMYGGETAPMEARTCRNGSFGFKAKKASRARGCMEGEVSYFTVRDGSKFGGETTPMIAKVCRNGRYVKMN